MEYAVALDYEKTRTTVVGNDSGETRSHWVQISVILARFTDMMAYFYSYCPGEERTQSPCTMCLSNIGTSTGHGNDFHST